MSDCDCGNGAGINVSGGSKVKVDASDTLADFLINKLQAGTNVTFTILNPGGDEKIEIDATAGGASDHKVAVTGTDSSANFLANKLVSTALFLLNVLNPGGNEQLQIAMNPGAANTVLVTNGGGTDTGFSLLVNANVDPAAAIAGTKISPNFGSQNVTTTGSGTFNGITDSALSTGVVHSNGAGLFSSSLIVNADVNAAAAIAGTKISPNFGSQNVTTTGSGTFNGITDSALGVGIVHSDGGGAFTSSLIVNADVDAAAAIDVSKLAAGNNGDVLQTVLGVPTWDPISTGSITPGAANTVLTTNGAGTATQWTTIVNANVDAAAAIAGTKISPNFGSQNVTTTGSGTFNGITDSALSTGVVHSNGAGLFSSSLIVNADVNAAAAIAGTKISPNFGSQNVTTTGSGTFNGITDSALGVGIVHSDGGGAFTSSLIVNADVDAAAAIAGTKISPNFGSQNVVTTGTGSFGATTVTSLTDSGLGLGVVHSSAGGLFSSSLIVNADVNAAAAIAGTKISPNFGSQNVVTTGTGSFGATTVTSFTDSGLGLGVVHSDVSGNFTSSLIVNADVDAAAAIAGTKISPNFGSQNVFTTGSIYAGTATTTAEQAGSIVAVSTGSTTLRGLITAQHSTDANSANIVSQKSRGTRSAPTTVANADGTLSIISQAHDGTNYLASAQIQFSVDAAPSAGSVSQQIQFLVGTGNAPTNAMTISNTGFVNNGSTYKIRTVSNVMITAALAVIGTGLTTTPVATVGDIRGRNNSTILAARNAADSADIAVINVNSSNNLVIGQSTVLGTVQLSSLTSHQLAIGGNVQITVNTSRFEITRPSELSWAPAVTSPTITHQSTSVAAAQDLWMSAQSTTQAGNNAGGVLFLSGGQPHGTGIHGAVRIAINADNTKANLQTVLEVADPNVGNRVIAMCQMSGITTTQLPANTGDGVVYLANAQTNPTANPVGGGILYSSGGTLFWRGSGGTVTTIALS